MQLLESGGVVGFVCALEHGDSEIITKHVLFVTFSYCECFGPSAYSLNALLWSILLEPGDCLC